MKVTSDTRPLLVSCVLGDFGAGGPQLAPRGQQGPERHRATPQKSPPRDHADPRTNTDTANSYERSLGAKAEACDEEWDQEIVVRGGTGEVFERHGKQY